MIIDKSPQGSEAWELIRKGKATGSEIKRILTPARLQFAKGDKGAFGYACEKVVELLGVDKEESHKGYWVDRGNELEPQARKVFQQETGLKVVECGFIMPHAGARYGCSVDGLIDDHAIYETKCVSPHVLVKWHADGVVPDEHVMQCQFNLFVTGREMCYFHGFHPQLNSLIVVSMRDEKYQSKFGPALEKFNAIVDEIKLKVKRVDRPELDAMTQYVTEEVEF